MSVIILVIGVSRYISSIIPVGAIAVLIYVSEGW